MTALPFSVYFNPETYSISHSNETDVNRHDLKAANQSIVFTYLDAKPSDLSVELLFDTYESIKPSMLQNNVRESYTKLRQYMQIDSELHAPPVLLFAWGKVNFVGVLSKFDETFTMFSDTGTPVRAKLKITLTGGTADELKIKATHSPDRTKIRTVQQKQTLWELAAREYGSPEQWRAIADRNGILNPRKLRDASRIVIPSLPSGGFPDGEPL